MLKESTVKRFRKKNSKKTCRYKLQNTCSTFSYLCKEKENKCDDKCKFKNLCNNY